MKDKNKLVSCIITTCKREKLLSRAIDSVLNQTHKNIELIVIDDCPCAKTESVVGDYLQVNPNMQYIQNEKNLGPLGARNKAVAHAKGEYIAFLDDDDYWHENKIKKQMSYAANYSAVSCIPIICNKNSQVPQKAEFEGSSAVYNTGRLFKSTRHIFPSGLLMKKSYFEAVGGFNLDFVEHDFFYKVSKEIGDMIVIADNLVYFDRNNNTDRVSEKDEAYRRLLMVYLKYQNELPEDIFRQKMSDLYKKRAKFVKSNLMLKIAMLFMSYVIRK